MNSNFSHLKKAQTAFFKKNLIDAALHLEKYKIEFNQKNKSKIEKQISIIIIANHSNEIVNRCLHSIITLKYIENKDIELILINTNKQRKPTQLAISDEKKLINYIDLKENILPSEARNIGAIHAIGKWLYFIDDDAIATTPPDELINIIELKNIKAARGQIAPITNGIKIPSHYNLGSNIKPTTLNTEGNLIINKKLFMAVGGFDPLLYGHEGNDLYLRCIQLVAKEQLVFTPKLTIRHDPSQPDKAKQKEARNKVGKAYIEEKNKKNNEIRGLAIIKLKNTNEIIHTIKAIIDTASVKIDFLVLTETMLANEFSFEKLYGNHKIYNLKESTNLLSFFNDKEYSFLSFVLNFNTNIYSNIKNCIELDFDSYSYYNPNHDTILIEKWPHQRAKNINEIISEKIKLTLINRQIIAPTTFNSNKKLDVLVTSFYTPDEYYSGKAKELIKELEKLNLKHDIRVFEIPKGMTWPEVCRKKVGFYYKIFKERRDEFKKMIWIDVDCKINYLPSFVLDFDVDFMAFRRGFPHSAHNDRTLTRHWEPCFFVFNNTNNCLRLLEDANRFEETQKNIIATDDYFFEESWRLNGGNMTTFEIPGEMSSRGFKKSFTAIESKSLGVFFDFGDSGNVQEYKGKVQQHEKSEAPIITKISTSTKKVNAPPLTALIKKSENNREILKNITETFGIGCTENERELVRSLRIYENGGLTIPLFWWIRPSPGNMGDWLSPYVLNKITGNSVKYGGADKSKLISIGSIGKFAKDGQVVWGTGISTRHTELNPNARYIAVRGPYTAEAVKASGGKDPSIFGDPGIILPEIYKPTSSRESGRYGLVRHFVHHNHKLTLSDDIDDINILLSSPEDIETFINRLNCCEAIATTSLHVLILCLSYNIPCRLIKLENEEAKVHGDGIKYLDFFEGVNLKPILHASIKNRLTSTDIKNIVDDNFVDPMHAKSLIKTLNEKVKNNPEWFFLNYGN